MGAAGDYAAVSMRAAVKQLIFGAAEEKREAAGEIARLARSDEQRKRLLPKFGVVPPLVSMLASGRAGTGARMAAAGALLELARGTHRNKVHIVKAGLLKKLPQLMDDKELSRSHQLALLLLSISSLASTDFPLSASELLPFLVATLSADDVSADTKLSCLATLRNLSTKLEHVRDVVSSGAVHSLLSLCLDKQTSEAALSILGDLAATSAVRKKAMEEDEMAPRALMQAMTWHESARCQEHATYLVMVLAHGSPALRRKMRQLGAVQALLEVSLLGSPLAQRRAAKILQWFKDEGQDRVRAHSGPRMEGTSCHGNDGEEDGGGQEVKGCRNGVDKIVKQSLDRNMKSILRRATASVDLTNVKLLVTSSSSKSLPC
ncbi:U-box domain-containing protein 1 [Phragmites australis]|uniref:U-box domain-containing protein 1 n=1 Tax=Phragmites australis TaxID=29695 RepID=UPI002D784BE4|nr:U-box domain-containing protein 1 [Phragmites australis]